MKGSFKASSFKAGSFEADFFVAVDAVVVFADIEPSYVDEVPFKFGIFCSIALNEGFTLL